ncbi:hypothetical protein [Sorangium sp. So ce1097]|uniref:hypothetical protein n=1 Tax=Sorangium sp. So ce1097 TaxID=3133330 RepID=UPI003F604610
MGIDGPERAGVHLDHAACCSSTPRPPTCSGARYAARTTGAAAGVELLGHQRGAAGVELLEVERSISSR